MPLGIPELLIILVLVLIVFGAGRLPDVMSSMGKGVSEFRKASSADLEDPKPEPAAKPEPEPKPKPEAPAPSPTDTPTE